MWALRAATLFLGGSHPQEVARLPAAELRSLRIDGAILAASMVFNFAIWTSALLVAEKPWWAAVPVGLLVTTLIGLVDRQVLSSLISHEGEQIAARFGVAGFFPVDRRRRLYLAGGRVALSLASMTAAMLLLRTSLFAPDIEAHLQRRNAEANRVVRQHAEAMVDAGLADAQVRLAKATAERDELRGRLSIAEAPTDTAAVDAQIAAERRTLDETKAQFRTLVQQYYEAKRAAAAEEAGVKEREADSGRDGRGERYRYQIERQTQIRQQAGVVGSTGRAAKERIEMLIVERQRLLDQQHRGAQEGLSNLTPRIDAADGLVKSLRLQRLADERARPAMIEQAMRADPSFVALRTGLIARVEALADIEGGSWSARSLSIAIGIAASILELAVVLFRSFLGSPGPVGFIRLRANRALVEELINEADGNEQRHHARAAVNDNRDNARSNAA